MVLYGVVYRVLDNVHRPIRSLDYSQPSSNNFCLYFIRLKEDRAAIKVKPFRRGKREKDELDLQADRIKCGFRAIFTSRENAAILIAVVVARLMKLDVNVRNYWVPAREMIHAELEEAKDKTVEALTRRGRLIMRLPENRMTQQTCVSECRRDPNLRDLLNFTDDDWKEKYKVLYQKIRDKYRKQEEKLIQEEIASVSTAPLPDTLQEVSHK